MSSIKEVLKSVREDALALMVNSGLEERDVAKGQQALLLFVATAALMRLEGGEAEEVAPAAKAARRQLKAPLAQCITVAKARKQPSKRSRDDAESDEQHVADHEHQESVSSPAALGQYANAGVFTEDASKRAKFARLMGGTRSGRTAEEPRNTQAADHETVLRIHRDLANQYESALSHKGKKGLGA